MKAAESHARQMIEIVWHGAESRSWRRLNATMQSAVHLAIAAGLKFAADDFDYFYKRMNGGYWFGADHEHFYSAAVMHDNTSACRAWEKFVSRAPVILDGRRLHIGAPVDARHLPQERVYGTFAQVTSFSVVGSKSDALIVCQYGAGVHHPPVALLNGAYEKPSRTPTRKFRLTFEEIRAWERARVKAAKAEKETVYVQ